MTDLETIESALAAATPGPWAFSYSSVVAPHKYNAYEAWLDSIDDNHSLDRSECEVCGAHCNLNSENLDRDYFVCSVPATYGDTATGERVANADLIANAPTWLAELVNRVRTAEKRAETAWLHGYTQGRLGTEPATHNPYTTSAQVEPEQCYRSAEGV